MYLAEHIINGRKTYVIRVSQYNSEAACWQSRDVYRLGRKPWDYIEYPGGNAFYVKEEIGERLKEAGVKYDLCELEELFWRFIRRDIRWKIEPFYCRSAKSAGKGVQSEKYSQEQLTVFDKRRMYYLRCGAADQRRIDTMPLRYFKVLLHKSRDEIEQHFVQLEKSLHPREYKLYVYVIFDLQRYFRSSPARSIPQALNQEDLDSYFIKDICSLHQDAIFWQGFEPRDRLHEYLARYAVMFFDYEFDGGSAWDEYLRNFISSRRFYRPPARQTRVTITEVVKIFGMDEKQLQAMGKSELTKLFRQKAHELHPDKGGEHDEFVRLVEAYKELLRKKR